MKYIVNDPSFDLVSDQHTAAQWVLSAATGIERLAGGMSLAYIARLRDAWAEIERLQGLMAESLMLSHLVAEPGGLRLEGTVPHWMARRVAESFFESLGDAENFVIVHFESDQGPIEVTVRRPGGKPVATVQAEQLAEIERLRAENGKLRAGVAKWRELGPWYAIGGFDGDNLATAGPGYDRPLLTNDREDAEETAFALEGTVVEYTGAENE